ncbi:putative intracellular protein transport protein [Golovinomyces cichoracearum]|uniref:Putative intracellular protein transport protein n=1 Tax=Golovinomyces cichoracearum TaxID=62708 RepID=A0A420J3A8_9PEZI|nr:putative intracellular protein transport protein [Golovinomyces cichoracearum]
MSIEPSDIRVFVDWIESTVFAGEEVKCNIIIRNIATNDSLSTASIQPHFNDGSNRTENFGKKSLSKPDNSTRSVRTSGHRTTLSLNFPTSTGIQHFRLPPSNVPANSDGNKGLHKRSVSIISIGTSERLNEQGNSLGNLVDTPGKTSRSHGRSASLQVISNKQASFSQNLTTPTTSLLSPGHGKSPLSHNVNEHSPAQTLSTESSFNSYASTVQNDYVDSATPHLTRLKSPVTPKFYREARSTETRHKDLSTSQKQNGSNFTKRSQIPNTEVSPTSFAGKINTSGESSTKIIRSLETFSSELETQVQKPSRLSNISSFKRHNTPETLMMGYAQLHGSFTLDSSLINQAPFEEVKKKGIIEGQGGGVVSVEKNKRDSGLLRGYGWASIGDSLGGFLGSNELSSIKEFRDIMGSPSIPLLATPKSILFVDLQLGPGESKRYSYSFKLPLGLPPSHRGKAIKIIYKLVIGIQRPGGAKEQQFKSIDVPFRVLGSVDSSGKLLCHDLMSPHIILQDQACIRPLPENSNGSFMPEKTSQTSEITAEKFVSYADWLLSKSRNQLCLSNPSSQENSESRRFSQTEEPSTAKEAIDIAILRSCIATSTDRSPSKFDIARSGRKVAVLMLARPSYRLGETINTAIDFTEAIIPCYAIHASLESSERVDNSISLRSEASIFRFTRKTHVTHSESTFFSNRVIFTPTIPTSATPQFVTSGVSLDWRIRVEFITPRLETETHLAQGYPSLLEKIFMDDYGMILAATESLECDSFQITVPLKVYGIHSAVESDISTVNWLAV